MIDLLAFLCNINIFGYTFSIKDIVLFASIVLNVVLILIFYRKYYFNHTPFVKVFVNRHRNDLPEFKIKVKNTGVMPIEMDAPVVIFKKKGSKRLFQVRTGSTGFPLSLFRKEEYDFFVDLARFYTTDTSLITYTKVYMEVRDKNQRKLARRRIKIT